MLLELHSPALESAFRIPIAHRDADDAALPHVRAWRLHDPVMVSPDAGGLKRAQRWALALGGSLATLAKARPAEGDAQPLALLGDVAGRSCILVDDMASTGATIAGAAKVLRAAGARAVHAFFVHAVMAPGAWEQIRDAGVERVATTDSIPLPAPLAGQLEVVPVAPLLARRL